MHCHYGLKKVEKSVIKMCLPEVTRLAKRQKSTYFYREMMIIFLLLKLKPLTSLNYTFFS